MKEQKIERLVPIVKIVVLVLVKLSISKKLYIYLFMINIIMDTIVGFRIQFFKSIIRPVFLIITDKFSTQLMIKLDIKPNMYPNIPSCGIMNITKNILIP